MKSRQSTGSSWLLPNRPATTFLKLKPFLDPNENCGTAKIKHACQKVCRSSLGKKKDENTGNCKLFARVLYRRYQCFGSRSGLGPDPGRQI
jgi:hypothetical protein